VKALPVDEEGTKVLSKVIPPLAAGAAHFKPVGETELSATMLQLGKGIILGSAQSCANVLDKRIIPILNCELWN
jgi:hypothetical protein